MDKKMTEAEKEVFKSVVLQYSYLMSEDSFTAGELADRIEQVYDNAVVAINILRDFSKLKISLS